MNRTDRLLAIVLELQARRYTRAADLADQFEISMRTIYRDVFALCESGVPVVSTPGRGYSLAPGYFLPPLMLTSDEAAALVLGAAFVADQVDAPYKQSVESARKKIETLLPETTRRELDFLQDSMRFVGHVRPRGRDVEARLTVIRRAILERRVLRLCYQPRRGEPGARDVEPHGLVSVSGRWLLTAYCRTREDMRTFRLDRIDDMTLTVDRFTRRDGYTVRQMRPIEYGSEEVRAQFDEHVLRWVREDLPVSFVAEEPHPRGAVFLFRPRDLQDLLPWLLSWGAAVRVIDPPRARQELGALTRAMSAMYP